MRCRRVFDQLELGVDRIPLIAAGGVNSFEKMKEKLSKMLDNLEYEDLLKLKVDSEMGSRFYQEAVTQKLDEVELQHRKVCASCGASMNAKHDAYTLLFGEQTIRKKASFCGMDCLQEFLTVLNVTKVNSLKKEVE